MIDFQTELLDPIYDALGIDAVLTPQEGPPVNVTVIDKTAGVEVATGDLSVLTVRPAADVRASELKDHDLCREDLEQAMVELNGARWTVTASAPRPTPSGEATGEVRLILSDDCER